MASCHRLHPTTMLQAGKSYLGDDCCRRAILRCGDEDWNRTQAMWSGRDRCHSGGFLLRIMPPSWHPVTACIPRQCCRRANPILATTAEGGLFFDAATKIGIGRGKRCRNDRSRRNHSPLPLRRLESDAESVETMNSAGETLQ